MKHPGRTSLLAIAALAGVLVVGLFVWPGPYRPGRLPTLDASRRRLESEALERYRERRAHGSFLPPGAITIALRESFLQRVISAALPFEQAIEGTPYRVRLDSASVDIERGVARVLLSGRGTLAADSTLYADLLIQGVIGIRELDFERARLAPRIQIASVHVLRAARSRFGVLANPVARYFATRSAEDWNTFQPPLYLPLQLAEEITLPAVEGDVTLPASSFPLRMRLLATTALEDRLVASVELLPDTLAGMPQGPPGGPWDAPPGAQRTGFAGLRLPEAPPPVERLSALAREVDTLAAADSLWRAVHETARDVVILVPEALLADLAGRLVRRYRTGLTADFRPGLVARVHEELRTKVLGARVKAGVIDIRVDVRHLAGRIVAPAPPTVTLEPPDGLEVRLPVRVEGGRGAARFDFEWDPAFLVAVVCRGFHARRTLEGTIQPLSHTLRGRVRFELVDGRIVGRPAVVRDRVRLRVALTPRSWDEVRAVFEEQDRFLRCGLVMDPDTMVAKLRVLGQKGVRVRLPGAVPAFDIPVRFRDTVADSAYELDANVHAPRLDIARHYLRLGFDADLKLRPVGAATGGAGGAGGPAAGQGR